MMYLRLGEDGFDRDCPKLVLFPPGGDPERIATIKVKRPQNGNRKDLTAQLGRLEWCISKG